MLAVIAAVALSALARDKLLLEAQLRASSNARAAFKTAVASSDPTSMRLACCIAAEETSAENDAVQTISTQVATTVAELAESAQTRLQLSSLLLDSGTSPASTALCVSTTLFGSSGAADDDEAEGFFQGAKADYYDPRNSFIDCVLARRQGIPITLSLVYMEVCEKLDLPMVGLNAPSHLLVAPANLSVPFVVDSFDGGALLDVDAAAQLIAQNAGFAAAANADARGFEVLRALRRQPMTSAAWCARMLRNLRAIHTAQNDVVRALGAAERLRLVAASWPEVSSPEEVASCELQTAWAAQALKWEARKDEARGLLQRALDADGDPNGNPRARERPMSAEARQQVENMLSDPWFG